MIKFRLCKSVVVFGKPLLPRAVVCLRSVAVLSLALAWFGSTAHAATWTWDGGGADNNWSTANNWNPNGAPSTGASGSDLVFSNATVRASPHMETDFKVQSITFSTNGGTFSITGLAGKKMELEAGSILNLNSGTHSLGMEIIDLIGNQTWNAGSGGLIFGGTTLGLKSGFILTIAGGGSITISNAAYDSGSIVMSGSGTLTLQANNTFTGTLTVNSGTVVFGNDGANGTGTLILNGGTVQAGGGARALNESVTVGGNFTVGGANNFTLSGSMNLGSSVRTITVNNTSSTIFSGVLSGTGGLTKTGTGTLTLSGVNTFSGVLTVQAGTLSIATINNASTAGVLGNSANAVVLGASGATGTLRYTGATASSTKTFTMAAGGTGAFQVDASGTTLTLSGVIGGSGDLAKTGAGTLALSGVNTYNGATTVSSGKIKVQNNTALGNTTGASSVASGAAIVIDGTGLVIAENISSLIGDGGGGGALENLLGLNTESGTIAFGGAARINSTAGTLTLSGAISGNGNAMTYGGAGNITISSIISGMGSPLTYDGAGTLTLSGANTYTGDTTVSAGTLKLGANNVIPNGSGRGNVSVGGILDLAGFSQTVNGLSGSGSVNNSTGSGSLTSGNNNASSTFGGVISGAVALTKTGTGTLTLSGANTYTGGTTLSQGTLRLGADNVIPDSGTFTFAGGILAANDRSDHIGALSLTVSSTLDFSAGGSAGYLSFNGGPASVGGGITLTINNWTGSTLLSGTDDRLYLRNGSDIAVTASQSFLDSIRFTGFADGATQLGSGEIVPVPEPINVALGVFGAVFLVFGFGRRLYKSARG